MKPMLKNKLDLRKEFPILNIELDGKRIVYLDSGATSQKPSIVIEAMKAFYETSNANIHRGIHKLSESAENIYDESKKKVAGLINCNPDQIVYTKNATEALNLLAYSLGEDLEEGDEIILTVMEHHSNLVPWQELAKRKNLNLWFIRLKEDYTLDLEDLKNVISERTKIISLIHLSNVLGIVNPVKQIKQIIDASVAPDVKLIVDGAQSVPHIKVDVQELGCDFFVFTGHKIYGPTGIGGFYGKDIESMKPFMTGGGTIHSVSLKETKLASGVAKFEAGTPPLAESAGLSAAINFIQDIGLESVRSNEKELMDYAIERLSSVEDVKIIGPTKDRIGVLSFNIGDIHSHDVADIFDKEFNIAIRPGHHCAQPLLNELGLKDCCRISFGIYNTKEDVDEVVKAIEKVKTIFGVSR
jgi:cysteine desulfurase / selenocysteine lyase